MAVGDERNPDDGAQPGHGPTGGGDGIGPRRGGASSFLHLRMPVWLAAALLLLTIVGFTVLLLTRDTVDLGPAVDGATDARVALTICNEIVDSRDINPRTAELDFEGALEDLGARRADVVIERVDCGPSVTAPDPG